MQIKIAYRIMPHYPLETLFGKGKFPTQRREARITSGKVYDIQMVQKGPGCPLSAREVAVYLWVAMSDCVQTLGRVSPWSQLSEAVIQWEQPSKHGLCHLPHQVPGAFINDLLQPFKGEKTF